MNIEINVNIENINIGAERESAQERESGEIVLDLLRASMEAFSKMDPKAKTADEASAPTAPPAPPVAEPVADPPASE